MNRRGVLASLTGALTAACSPVALLNGAEPHGREGRSVGRRVGRDIAYGDDRSQRMDVYAPDGGEGLATLVLFDGEDGGGSREATILAGQALASRGFLVAAPGYRLDERTGLPAFIEDAAAAAARAANIARAYGGDPDRLGVLGCSTGAFAATMIALDRRYMRAVGRPDLIKAAAGLAGVYDPSIHDPTLTRPATFARSDAPPLWLGHGEAEAEAAALHERIRAVGGRSEIRSYPGLNPAEPIAALTKRAAPALEEVSGFFHRVLG